MTDSKERRPPLPPSIPPPTADPPKPRPWTNSEEHRLVSLWPTRIPTRLIAWMLQRSPMAIAVKATKLGLPPRNSEAPDQYRNSAHWMAPELAFLIERYHNALSRIDRNSPGATIDIDLLARELDRSPNAVLEKLLELYGHDIIPYIRLDTLMSMADEQATPKDNDTTPPLQRLKQRQCLSCGRPFLSEGPHHRLCRLCRTS